MSVYPAAGVALSKIQVTKYAASGIFLIGGLKLRTDEAKEALRDFKSVSFGVLSILFFTGVYVCVYLYVLVCQAVSKHWCGNCMMHKSFAASSVLTDAAENG